MGKGGKKKKRGPRSHAAIERIARGIAQRAAGGCASEVEVETVQASPEKEIPTKRVVLSKRKQVVLSKRKQSLFSVAWRSVLKSRLCKESESTAETKPSS